MPSEQNQNLENYCHIHDKAGGWEIDDIHENVCVPASEYHVTAFEGRHYCLFHLPSKNKDIEKFNTIFYARLFNVYEQCAKIETEFPDNEEKQKKAKIHRKIKYDFRYVWFPSEITLYGRTFSSDANFRWATFSSTPNFNDAKFSSDADFRWATFSSHASFNSAKFSSDADFSQATFSSNTYFSWANFSSDANFGWATFSAETNFDGAKFSDTKLTSFYETNFEKNISFDGTEFNNDVSFNSTIFGKDSDVFFRGTFFAKKAEFQYCKSESYIRFEKLKQGDECSFDFQEGTFEKANRISFHTVRLQPNWFINIDSRKFVFTNCKWENFKGEPFKLREEIGNLKNRKIKESNVVFSNPYSLLTITCRQLAENAENNNRFEEASKFRQTALETEWLEKKEKISNWIKNLVPESEKLKRRFGGSTDEEDKPIPPTNSFGILRRSGDFFIHGLYRITSFYGESWSWALGVLLSLILVIFPIIYTQINFQTCSKDRPIATSLTICESKDEEIRKNCTCSTDQITFTDAIVQSLTTATLQNIEYRKPLTVWGEIWIILEKIFAPLQAALLALAIRRKFMR
jgi:hypothetical protein